MAMNLVGVTAKLSNVNPRAELHGEDTVLGADLSLSVVLGNDFLEQFDRGLKSFLYKEIADAPDLITDAGAMTELRFPLLGSLTHGLVGVGYEVVFSYGVDDVIRFSDTEINKIKLDCQQGGSVKVSFRVQLKPDESALAKLCTLIGHEVTITVSPPVATLQDVFTTTNEGNE